MFRSTNVVAHEPVHGPGDHEAAFVVYLGLGLVEAMSGKNVGLLLDLEDCVVFVKNVIVVRPCSLALGSRGLLGEVGLLSYRTSHSLFSEGLPQRSEGFSMKTQGLF